MKLIENKFLVSSLLFAISFIEGGSLMAIELIIAKIIAPFYGNSLTVWSAVLAVTLGGLAVGYFTGGVVSEKFPVHKSLTVTMGALSCFTLVIPFLSHWIMSATLDLPIKSGIFISSFVFIFPAFTSFGIISPLIIRLISSEQFPAGRAAGTVYAISTAGGVFFTFLYGFYFIPEIGLRASAWSITTILAAGTALSLWGSLIQRR